MAIWNGLFSPSGLTPDLPVADLTTITVLQIWSDAILGAACLAIHFALVTVVSRRSDLPHRWMFWVLAAFFWP